MPEKYARASIHVNAQPDRVWHVLTTPEYTRQFMYSCDAISDWQPGSELNWVGASGISGARLLTWRLDGLAGRRATVRLVFADPDRLEPGQQRFSVAVQGISVIPDLDVAAAADRPGATVIRDIPNVLLTDVLSVELLPDDSTDRAGTVLCGIRLIRE